MGNAQKDIMEKYFRTLVEKWEGGFSPKSHDGKVTLFGMTAQRYAERSGLPLSEAEAQFEQMSKIVSKTGRYKSPSMEQLIDIENFRHSVFNDYHHNYFQRPGFDKADSPHVGAIVADISFNRGAGTAWWCVAKALQENGTLTFPPELDPSRVADPLTDKSKHNPYRMGVLTKGQQQWLIDGLNTATQQQGEGQVIRDLAAAKFSHHMAHTTQYPHIGKHLDGWYNRLDDYESQYAAISGQSASSVPAVPEALKDMFKTQLRNDKVLSRTPLPRSNPYTPPSQNNLDEIGELMKRQGISHDSRCDQPQTPAPRPSSCTAPQPSPQR